LSVSSLTTKLSLAVSLWMTVLLTILAFSAFQYFKNQFKDSISRQQFTLVSALADEVDGKILSAQRELVAVAGSAAPDLTGRPRNARTFLDGQAGTRTSFDSGMALFSPQGRLIAASPDEPGLLGKDFAFRDYIRKTIASGRPEISAPFLSSQQHHHPIIMFTAPIFDREGRMTGILAGALDLLRDNFLGKLATLKIGENGYLYLYNRDRLLIIHSDRTRILQTIPPGANRLADRAIAGFEGTGETISSRGKPVFSSFKHLKSTSWILAANLPRSEAYAPIQRARWYLLAALLIVSGFSILTTWRFMHHLTAPLLLVTRHVREIAGKGDTSNPIPVTSRDEIGTMARAFNDMLAVMHGHETAIREQKEFSENLLLNSAVPTYVLDTGHRVVIWNRACEELTGIKAADILGTTDTWKGFYLQKHPVLADIVLDGTIEDLTRYYDSYNKSPFAPGGLQAEKWLSCNGKECYVFSDAVPVRNAEGAMIAVIQTVLDITERIRAKEELEFNNVILSTQMEATIDGILIVGEQNNIISHNRRFAELWDIPPELLASGDDGPALQLVTKQVADGEGFLARVKQLYEHREEKSRDEILLGDGRVFDRYSAPMLGAEGKYFGRVWYFRDITQRKLMEEALRESEERYRILVELSPDAIYIHTDGIFVFANPMGAALLGASRPEELYGKPVLDFVHPDSLDIVRQRIENACLRNISNPQIEEQLVRLDGSSVPVDMTSLTFNYRGRQSVLAVARDISERKKMQAELRQAQKMESIGTLAGGIAHDFNNILTAIVGYGHLALMEMAPDDPQRPNIEHMLGASDRATQLTRDLLLFSRKQISEKKPVDLNEIIRKVEKFLVRIIGEDIACKTVLQNDPVIINADPHQFEQIMMNLATNARDAMAYGGDLMISTERIRVDEGFATLHGHGKPGMYALVTISDTGEGMDEKTRQNIFEPFFTTKEVGKGTGLGLAVVYGIVKEHDGYIDVCSVPGIGTTFKIYLPLIASQAREEEIAKIDDAVLARGTETILLAEDDESTRKLISIILRQQGYRVIEAVDGRDAVVKYLEHRDTVHLLVFDLIMPKMNGNEAFVEISAVRPDLKAIFTSGYAPDFIRQRLLLERNVTLMFKPVFPHTLLKNVRTLLDGFVG